MNIKDFLKSKKITNIDSSNGEHSEYVHHCAICGAPETEVSLIIRSGTGEYVCDRCADIIYKQMDELYKYAKDLNILEQKAEEEKELNEIMSKMPTPHEIKAFLDDYVIGQDDAKVKLAVAVYNHYKRICQAKDDTDIAKSCCALIGATGSGKCVNGETVVTIRNKKTGEIQNISINDFKQQYCNE